jgi:hypothetical protein
LGLPNGGPSFLFYGRDAMAATRLIPMHLNKGKTLLKCLRERTDYAQNPAKTENGELVTSFECDPMTVDEEFLLAKRQYRHITGRQQKHEVIAYQIRQSFKPGEVTPEEANQIGRELAMRWTKGNHAFIVATHVDKAHIHNHIIFNSTSLDCRRKFKNTWLSSFAVQRVSDMICLEHGLSVIEVKPYREREKRTVYPVRKSQRDVLRDAIDSALQERPKDFEELLLKLQEQGYEVKREKHIALRGKEQQRFIRLDSLGDGYSKEQLCAVISGKAIHTPAKKIRYEKQEQNFKLLIDIQAKLASGDLRNRRFASVYNLKQISKTLLYLRDRKIGTMEELSAQAQAASERFDRLSDSIKASEKRLTEIAVLKKHIINYSKTRDTYAAYRKAGYSKKFFEAHREELTLHKAAKAAFDELGVQKLPRIAELNAEYATVLEAKKKAYEEYRESKNEMQELLRAKKNVELFFEAEQCQKEQHPRHEAAHRE